MLRSPCPWLQASLILRLSLTASIASGSGQKQSSDRADAGTLPTSPAVAETIKAACDAEAPQEP